MNRADYTTLKGEVIPLTALDADERRLLDELTDFQRNHPDWASFSNHWLGRVAEFYAARGLARRQVRDTAVYRVAQDLDSRLAVRAGLARVPDYRDELEGLIRTHFRTRRAFCEATGISEDLLSHVLARRKHLAIDTLSEALGRIGFGLRIAPLSKVGS
jgi:hypothetical protein